MTIEEQIQARQRTIEVPGSKLSETLMKIRASGGFIPQMDVNGCLYCITVHWGRAEEQKELL